MKNVEIQALKTQLASKDAKIREMEIEINSWQETHSQIYDSFTSATKLYREQIVKFNDETLFYKEKCSDLQRQLKLVKSRNSNDKMDKLPMVDIEAELEFNSDFSSSESS